MSSMSTDEVLDFESSSSESESDFDEQQEIARSSFADMLHDTERNQKYNEALKLAVDKMHSLGKKAKVLDIGTGSGLLSMMAVNCGADSVIACEAFTPIAVCAKKVIKINEFSDKIKVIAKHSIQLTVGDDKDLPEKANILVAEVFDTELIGEGALHTFNHALINLLEEDCIVIPSFATIYAQVVESKFIQNWNKFTDYVDNDDKLLIKIPKYVKDCAGSAAVHDIQLSQLSTDCFRQICAPQAVLKFDWSGKSPLSFRQRSALKVVAETSGTAHVVFMWWELGMDPDNTITLSCAPYWAHPLKNSNEHLTSTDIPWRDHWLQAIYYLPKEISVCIGQEFNLVSCHDNYSVWFYLENNLQLVTDYDRLICVCGLHIVHSRTRVGNINDDSRRKKYISFLKKHVTSESVILFLGNNFYLGLVAAKLGAKKLLFIKEDEYSAGALERFIACSSITNCEILQDVDALANHPDTKSITLILGEPYFAKSILPWDNVLFAHMVAQVKMYVTQDVVIAPKECVIKGALVEFINLQKTRFPIEVCGEFDMEPFDEVVQHARDKCDPEIEAQPLWEYPCFARSSYKILSRLNMCDIHSSLTFSDGHIYTEGAIKNFNAIVFWTEWNLDGTDDNVITTGPTKPLIIDEFIQWDMYTNQGVKFVTPKTPDGFYLSFDFNVESRSVTLGCC